MESVANFLDAVETALHGIEEATRHGETDGAFIRLECVFSCLQRLQLFLSRSVSFSSLLASVSDMTDSLQSIILDQSTSTGLPGPGRPRLEISRDQLQYLLDQQFTQVEVSRLLGCSPKTIHRRIVQFGLSCEYSLMSDSELDELVEEFVAAFPTAGQKTLAGHLSSLGYQLQRYRVRDSLYRVDPWGVEQRCRQVLHRRKYKVAGPNSLLHIDGHHKLIQWRIVTHGGIDGFSRIPVYLFASAIIKLRQYLKAS